MITESVLSAIFGFVSGILSRLPEINFVIPERVIVSASQYWAAACYILPMGTIKAILFILIGLQFFRIAVSLIKTIWALLPVV